MVGRRQDNETYISLAMSTAVALGFIFVALKSPFSTHGRRKREAAWERTLIFFWRHVMQPVLLRVYFGRLRCAVSADLERDPARSRALVVEDGCVDEE
jgi:hypothetical protein